MPAIFLFASRLKGTSKQGRNQGEAKGAEAPLFSQIKVEKEDKKFYFLVHFVHTVTAPILIS